MKLPKSIFLTFTILSLLLACNKDKIGANKAPNAVIGAVASPKIGDIVELNGTKSTDPANKPLILKWVLKTKPDGSNAVLTNENFVITSFKVDKVGSYIIALTVTNSDGLSDTEEITIKIIPLGKAPVVDAGKNLSTYVGELVNLDGTASYDPDKDSLVTIWSITTKPVGSSATIENANAKLASFTPDVVGEYKLNFSVNDPYFPTEKKEILLSVIENPYAIKATNKTVLIANNFGISNDYLTAIDANNGMLLWKSQNLNGYSIKGSPTYSIQLVFTADERNVVAIDATNGTQKWEFEVPKAVKASLITANGLLYVGCNDKKMYALDIASGSKKWEFTAPDAINSSPTYANETLYFGCNDGSFVALNTSNGSKKWLFKAEKEILSGAALSNGYLYFGSMDGNIYCVDAETGKAKWTKKLDTVSESSPTLGNGNVYVIVGGEKLVCLNQATGNLIWDFNFGSSMSRNESCPIYVQKKLYVCNGNKLYSFDANNGSVNWMYQTSGLLHSQNPTYANGNIYIGTSNANTPTGINYLIAIDAETGSTKFSVIFEGLLGSACVIDNKDRIFKSGLSGDTQ